MATIMENIYNNIKPEMVGLHNLPKVNTFLGLLDLKTGSMIISAICVFHPMVYGCTFFMPMSYLLLTIWTMLVMFFAASLVLFVGLINNNALLIDIWIWYTLVFIVIMLMLLFLLALVYTLSKQRAKVFIVILGILWYIVTVYFILVVNSHRKTLIDATRTIPSQDSSQSKKSPQLSDPPKAKDPPDDRDPTDDTDSKGPETRSGFRRGKQRLKVVRKASAKNSKQ